MPQPIYMHINYFEADYRLEEAFAFAKELGFDGIELRDRDRSGKQSLASYLDLTASLSDRYQLPVIYGCRLATTAESEEQRAESLANFQTVIEFSANRDIGLLNAFAGSLPANTDSSLPEVWEKYLPHTVDMMSKAAAYAAERGVSLCIETHFGYLHDTAAHTQRLLKEIGSPHLFVNFDYSNIFLSPGGESLAEAFALLEESIGYVHLKNTIKPRRTKENSFILTPLSDGDINHRIFVKRLREINYTGPIGIENTMGGDKYPVAAKDLAYLRSLLEQ